MQRRLNRKRGTVRNTAAARLIGGLTLAWIGIFTATACSPGLLALLYVFNELQSNNSNTNSDNDNSVDRRCPPPVEAGAGSISYANDVRPLFQAHGCLSSGCHGGFFPSSGYSLKEYHPTFGPGDDAAGLGVCEIVPGDAGASFLIEKLRDEPRSGARMPLLREPLTSDEISVIEQWINEGAQNN